jgi:NAD(P) transhydrogenase subunit alpha
MIADLTPGKDGTIVHDMADDVIRGSTVAFAGEITFPPPPPKVRAIAAQKPADRPKELTPVERRAQESAKFRQSTRQQVVLLILGGLFTLLVGAYAPPAFMGHFIVFALACFVGYQVIWGVSHALHTPLMAVTNAISGIIIIGALLQFTPGGGLVRGLAALSVAIAMINIVGGFMVTRRMLNMFQRS